MLESAGVPRGLQQVGTTGLHVRQHQVAAGVLRQVSHRGQRTIRSGKLKKKKRKKTREKNTRKNKQTTTKERKKKQQKTKKKLRACKVRSSIRTVMLNFKSVFSTTYFTKVDVNKITSTKRQTDYQQGNQPTSSNQQRFKRN